jgi:hypothetical protein
VGARAANDRGHSLESSARLALALADWS